MDNRIMTVDELIAKLKKVDGKTKIAIQCQDSGDFYSEILSGCEIIETTIGRTYTDSNGVFDKQKQKDEKLLLIA